VRDILFVAGEVSGDLHGAGVAAALRAANAPFNLTGVGGDAMRDAGVRLIEHTEQLAVMGFIEPIKRLPRLYRLRRGRSRVDDFSTRRCGLGPERRWSVSMHSQRSPSRLPRQVL